MTIPFRGRTAFITGASRGIGKAIALRLAAEGADVIVTGKTVEPHRTLPGTIYTAAGKFAPQGGSAIAIPMDVRDEVQVERAVARAIDQFGRIDIVVNNASAISLTGTATTPDETVRLNGSGERTWHVPLTQKCLPHLKRAAGRPRAQHAPPLNFAPRWFAPHAAYSISNTA